MKYFILVLLLALIAVAVGQRKKKNQVKQSTTCGSLQVIPGDVRTITPWSAGIFTVSTKARNGEKPPPRFFNTGLIIGPSLIMTLVGGPFGVQLKGSKQKEYRVPPVEAFLIAAGINSTILPQKDGIAQYAKVRFIESTRVVEENEFYHVYLFHLSSPLNFGTPYVREICLPLILKGRNQTPYGWQLIQGGFAQTISDPQAPKLLKAWKVTTGPKPLCESMFRYHYKQEIITKRAFCGRRDVVTTTRGSPFAVVVKSVDRGAEDNTYCELHGSSLTFSLGNVWYLGSMVGMIPGRKRGRCDHKSFYVFVDTLVHLDWIHNSYECSPNFACQDGSCVPLNKVCDGVPDCKDKSDEEPNFCASQNPCFSKSKSFSCSLSSGKCVSEKELCDGKKDCENGSDENPSNCQAAKLRSQPLTYLGGTGSCEPIKLTEGLIATCKDLKDQVVPCTQSASPGTRAELKCDPYHTGLFVHDSVDMVCDGGTWRGQKAMTCAPACGITPEPSKPGYPWHALIFTSSNGERREICSATLIEKSFLLTSTKCVSDWIRNSNSRSSFYAVVNPDSRPDFRDVGTLKTFSFKQIWTYENSTTEGLAIIGLQSSVRTHQPKLPLPVCYMIAPFKTPIVGQSGMITGFSLTGGESSESPQVGDVTIKEKKECESNGLTVTKNQFCVQVNEGNSHCKADVGGGLLVKQGSTYVLKGVSDPSKSDNCDSKYGVFTNIEDHSSWILDILEANS